MGKEDALKDIFSLRERVNKLFEDAASRTGAPECAALKPLVDIYEAAGEFVVTAELPGVLEADVNIKVENNMLKISGERKSHKEGRSYHQLERCRGVFSRSFVLPSVVDAGCIKAAFRDGILKVTLPKKSEELPKHIEIK